MVYHQIHDYAKTSFVGFRKHLIEILHGSEFIHDRLIIADIVTVVVVWRFINGREPDHVDPQVFQIIQTACDSLNVSDTVSVAVHKAARVDLIDHSLFPPCSFHNSYPFYKNVCSIL